jgi:hypothetical protein
MDTRAKGLVVLGMVAGLLVATAVRARDSETKPMDMLMGGNFQIIARVLSDLVDARYASLPGQAQLMVQHAAALSASPPVTLQNTAERAVFQAYATNLRLAATQFLAVSERLAKRDKTPNAAGDLSLDYLRSSAAQQFGNIVTACALCHSQFKQQAL